MTPTKLKQNHEEQHPESNFFSRDTMNFFGDTMANFGCYDGGDVWVLHRKKPVNHNVKGRWYFDKTTFKQTRKGK